MPRDIVGNFTVGICSGFLCLRIHKTPKGGHEISTYVSKEIKPCSEQRKHSGMRLGKARWATQSQGQVEDMADRRCMIGVLQYNERKCLVVARRISFCNYYLVGTPVTPHKWINPICVFSPNPALKEKTPGNHVMSPLQPTQECLSRGSGFFF